MRRFLSSSLFVILAILALASACNNSDTAEELSSTVKSDWLGEASPAGVRSYGVDWSCEPKQFGASAETRIKNQDEYCEWKTVKTTATEKLCRFTVSFDRSRDFYLNSRGMTPVNSIAAARRLVKDCNNIALSRLKKGQTPGKLCSGINNGCVSGRNSDPEICDKIRWATGERYKGNIDYCVDQLSPNDWTSTEQALMQFGVVSDIPQNCEFADEEKTELLCTIPPEDTCFSTAGQIRVGLRVVTKAKVVEAEDPSLIPEGIDPSTFGSAPASASSDTEAPKALELPPARECFVP